MSISCQWSANVKKLNSESTKDAQLCVNNFNLHAFWCYIKQIYVLICNLSWIPSAITYFDSCQQKL